MRRHQSSSSFTSRTGPATVPRRNRGRQIGIAIGDLLLMTMVGAATTAAMHLCHMTGWGFLVEMVVGMVVAMVVQVVLAWLAAPLLGSIEAMVPSMLLAMIAPMAVCVLHGTGSMFTWTAALVLGGSAGVLAFLLLALYGVSCRRWAVTLGSNYLEGLHP